MSELERNIQIDTWMETRINPITKKEEVWKHFLAHIRVHKNAVMTPMALKMDSIDNNTESVERSLRHSIREEVVRLAIEDIKHNGGNEVYPCVFLGETESIVSPLVWAKNNSLRPKVIDG